MASITLIMWYLIRKIWFAYSGNRLDVVNDTMKLVERLGGLGIKIDVASEIELFHIIETLNDDSR